tara:strand:- start:8404 stop:8628 length:225 start_codon:yes stop_codon:yes gene_type:complete
MLNRAEFEIGSKVHFWNGKNFVKAVVTNLNLNPIDNIIEYRLFYREGTDRGKRSRIYLNSTPMFIRESVHFKGK